MAGNDLADLEALRGELVKLQAIIADPRAASGTKRRAAAALGLASIKAIDLSLAMLRKEHGIGDDPV